MQHEAKTSKNGINGISQRLGPPIPPYERPEALIYQAKEPPVRSCCKESFLRIDYGCVERMDAQFFIGMENDEHKKLASIIAAIMTHLTDVYLRV